MSAPTHSPHLERWALATLDHHAAGLGYSAVPESRPRHGAWRRLYIKDGGAPLLSAVGASDAPWCSLGIEIPVLRSRLAPRLETLLADLAPYEVAIDADAGADNDAPDAVLRIALRVFLEGLTGGVLRDAVDNVAAAAAAARRTLGLAPAG
jgi:hypothetical protein